uniref:BolA protein n=1 Tax=Oryza meridionalis TaxID=40149 RepID=A0A0E0E214_9ORYZ
MQQMRSAAAAAPCSLAAMLLRRFAYTSYSSSCGPIRRHAAVALSSTTTTRFAAWSPPPPSCGARSRGFAAWASAPGPAGSTDSPAMQALETKIKEQLEADTVTVVDTSGDGRHLSFSLFCLSIDVVSKVFEGKSAVNRQRMVYKAIWEELQSTVHAVDQMTTKTPSEASANQ